MSSIGLQLPRNWLTLLHHPDLGYAVTQKKHTLGCALIKNKESLVFDLSMQGMTAQIFVILHLFDALGLLLFVA